MAPRVIGHYRASEKKKCSLKLKTIGLVSFPWAEQCCAVAGVVKLFSQGRATVERRGYRQMCKRKDTAG